MTLSQLMAAAFFITYFLVAAYAVYTDSHAVKRAFALLTLSMLLGSGISGEHYWPFFDWHFMSDALDDSETVYDVSLVDSSREEHLYPFWETPHGYLAFPTVYHGRMLSKGENVVPTLCYLLREGKKWHSHDKSGSLSYLRFPPHIDYSREGEEEIKVEALRLYSVKLDLDSDRAVKKELLQEVDVRECS
jgi:hypothetical protein